MTGIADAWIRILEERQRMTPATGYNVLLLNEYDPHDDTDDRLELLTHVDTWEQAQKAREEFVKSMKGKEDNILIYPPNKRNDESAPKEIVVKVNVEGSVISEKQLAEAIDKYITNELNKRVEATDYLKDNVLKNLGSTNTSLFNVNHDKEPKTVQLNTMMDDKVCPLCEEYEDAVFEEDDPEAPIPPLHPNCRCWIDEVYEESTGKTYKVFRLENGPAKEYNTNHDEQGRFTYSDSVDVPQAKSSDGVFETGKAVTFSYMHNTQKSPYLDSRFGQDIEPAGQYIIQKEPGAQLPPGWVQGQITFEKPLVIAWSSDGKNYDWKQKLSDATGGLKGAKLSSYLRSRGYDGIVTIDNGNTSEIVNLKGFSSKRKKKEYNTNHDPETGQFTSGDGSSDGDYSLDKDMKFKNSDGNEIIITKKIKVDDGSTWVDYTLVMPSGVYFKNDPEDLLKKKLKNIGYKKVEFNPNHDPKTGQFTSGPGGAGDGKDDDSGGVKFRSNALKVKGEKPLNYDEAFARHEIFFKSTQLTGYSFDPITGKGYDLTNKDAAREFYARHADGENDLYLIATTNHVGQHSRENHAGYEQITNSGQYPLMGYWKSPDSGNEYNDVSFPVDGGISREEVDKLLVNYKQESTIKIDKNGDFEFIDASIQDKIKSTSPRPLKKEKIKKN